MATTVYVDRLFVRGLRDGRWRVVGTVICAPGADNIAITQEYDSAEKMIAGLSGIVKD